MRYENMHELTLFQQGQLNNRAAQGLLSGSNGALRVTSVFFELLEKQFPIAGSDGKMRYRFPVDFAGALSVHVNHLNRCLKHVTHKTTSQHITERIMLEAAILLCSSRWNVCEIGYCFGFEDGAHFINFFKRNAKMSPTVYRKTMRTEITAGSYRS